MCFDDIPTVLPSVLRFSQPCFRGFGRQKEVPVRHLFSFVCAEISRFAGSRTPGGDSFHNATFAWDRIVLMCFVVWMTLQWRAGKAVIVNRQATSKSECVTIPQSGNRKYQPGYNWRWISLLWWVRRLEISFSLKRIFQTLSRTVFRSPTNTWTPKPRTWDEVSLSTTSRSRLSNIASQK